MAEERYSVRTNLFLLTALHVGCRHLAEEVGKGTQSRVLMTPRDRRRTVSLWHVYKGIGLSLKLLTDVCCERRKDT